MMLCYKKLKYSSIEAIISSILSFIFKIKGVDTLFILIKWYILKK